MRYGLYDARGYDYPVEKRYDKLWRAQRRARRATSSQPTQRGRAAHRRAALRALSLLSVDRRDPGPRRPAAAAARACGSPTAAPTRASTATPTRCRACSSSARQRTVAERRRGARRDHRAGLRRAAAWRSPSARLPGMPDEPAAARRRARARWSPTSDERVGGRAPARRRREPAGAHRRALPGLEGDRRRQGRPTSSAWTTCCAAWWCPPGTHTVEFRYEPPAGGSAGSSRSLGRCSG